MRNFDTLRDYQFENSEMKLNTLRHELLRELALIDGYAALLKQASLENKDNNISDDWKDWVNQIIEANLNAREILSILTIT